MNPPAAVLGGGVHGKVCWLIAYMHYDRIITLDNDMCLGGMEGWYVEQGSHNLVTENYFK